MRRNKNDRVPLTDGQFGDLKKKKKKKKAAFDLEEFEKELGESRDADNVDGTASGADGDNPIDVKEEAPESQMSEDAETLSLIHI